jgi:mannose-1-phosphate guanylyltransferase
VILEGLEDFIVVETDEALLICRKDQEQKIKEIVMDIKMKKGEKFL